MADEIQDANVIHIFQEMGDGGTPQNPPKWIATIGPKDQGKEATGINPIEATIALVMRCHNEHWPFDLGWQPEHRRARYTPPTPPERPAVTAGHTNPSVPIPEAYIDPGPKPGPIPPKPMP